MLDDLLVRAPVLWLQLAAGVSCFKFIWGNCVGCPIPGLTNSEDAKNGKAKKIEELLGECHILVEHKHLHRGSTEEYKKIRIIGTGTFSRVYLVEHGAGLSQSRQAVAGSSRRFYAMKVLHKAHLVLLKQAEHVNQERAILASLRSPFIVQMYQHWQDNSRLYMLMEYVPGGELFAQLRRCGKFEPATARFYTAELVVALEYLHGEHVIYRDLKPENVLLDSAGHVKLTDFGFAKRMSSAYRTKTIVGTPDYIAPEIIRGCGYTDSVDWWALGILVYEMLAGEAPFSDSDHYRTYQNILDARWHFPPDFDPAAHDLVRRLTTPEPDKRLGSTVRGRAGAADVKRHCWFADVNWAAVVERTQPAPFVPTLQHDGDTTYFEEYDENGSDDDVSSPGNDGDLDKYSGLFLDF